MLNKKIVAIKQEGGLKAGLKSWIDGMTPAELARVQTTINQVVLDQTLLGILSQIGHVYEVPFTDGRKTLAVILTYEGVRRLGIDLNTVFRGCEVFNEETDVKNGVLVNLDLVQQFALLRAIIAIRPELENVLGLYTYRGSKEVLKVLLGEKDVPKQLGIRSMWTAGDFISRQKGRTCPKEGIITLNDPYLRFLHSDRFAVRHFDNDDWNYIFTKNFHGNSGAVVFGAQK